MQFVPLWTNILRSRKVASLPDDLYRTWTQCLVMAQEHDHRDGSLPNVEDFSYMLHMDVTSLMSRLSRLVRDRFLDLRDGIYYVHDWDDWKHRPDPTGAARKRAQRDRERQRDQEVASSNGEQVPSEDVTVTSVTSQKSQCHAPPHLTSPTHTTHTPLPPVTGGSVCAGDSAPPPDEGLEPFQAPIDPPQACWTSEQRRVLDKAAKWWGASNGIEIVGGLLNVYPAGMIDQAIDSHHGKVGGRIHRGRLEGFCVTIWDEGRWKPVERKSKGVEVPYVSGTPTPNYIAPRIHDPGPSIPADEAYRIMTGRQKGASAS